MDKEKWKCPYAGCTQECSRHSNMVRHIFRLHGGPGDPVKVKSPVIDHSIQKMYANSDTPSAFSRKRPPNAQTKEIDIVDMMYEKVNKFKEVMVFFSAQPISTIFPLPSPLLISTIDPPVGFRTYVCANCLAAPIDTVRLSDFKRKGPLAFRSTHVCEQEHLVTKRLRAGNGIITDVIKTWDKLRSSSIEFMANLVHQWHGPQNDVPIHVLEVDDSSCQSDELLPINLGTIANSHWVHRALGGDKRKGTTTIDERELMKFLNLAKCTLALFRVKKRNEEKDLYAYIGPELM